MTQFETWTSPRGEVQIIHASYSDATDAVRQFITGPYQGRRAKYGHVISDPPYLAEVHAGHNAAPSADGSSRRRLSYQGWDGYTARRLGDWAMQLVNGWVVLFADHVLWRSYNMAGVQADRYTFAPVPVIQRSVRLSGDGPSSDAVYLAVSRPATREMARWGALPGHYIAGRDRTGHIGGKPLDLMRRIIRDYSRPGDVIVDPCAGYGTTLLAAAIEGRRAIGVEIDEDTFWVAVKHLQRGWTPTMFPSSPNTEQLTMT